MQNTAGEHSGALRLGTGLVQCCAIVVYNSSQPDPLLWCNSVPNIWCASVYVSMNLNKSTGGEVECSDIEGSFGGCDNQEAALRSVARRV